MPNAAASPAQGCMLSLQTTSDLEKITPCRRLGNPVRPVPCDSGLESMRSKSPELDQIRTEVADINQAHFCVFLRSSATVVLPTYQSSARISSKTTQTSFFGSCNTSLIASVT